jgi:hypothetical protein
LATNHNHILPLPIVFGTDEEGKMPDGP